MKYEKFLENRGSQFRRVAVSAGDGVVCTSSFGAIGLTTHVWGLASSRLERELVDDIGGYGVMQGHCEIEPLVEFVWKTALQSELRIVVQYVKDRQGRTFICVQRGSHTWYALARISQPDNSLLLSEFFSSRRSHDGEGFGFCASKGIPEHIYNYRPELLDRETICNLYGWWLRWAESQTRWSTFHYGAWKGEVKHGVGNRRSYIAGLKKAIKPRIAVKTLNRTPSPDVPQVAGQETPLHFSLDNAMVPPGLSFKEKLQWYRDGFESLAGFRFRDLIERGKFEDARAFAEKLIVIVADKPEALADGYMKLGRIDERLEDFENASVSYRRAVALEPTNRANWYFAHNNLGFCLNQLGRFGEAEPYLRQAISIEPARHKAYKNLGISLAGQLQYAEAAKLFVEATVLDPHDPRALSHLEELLEEHEIVYLQLPQIRSELENCREQVNRQAPGQQGIRRISPPAKAESPDGRTEDRPVEVKTVALLDDEDAMIEIVGQALAEHGYEVLACADKRTFLRRLPGITVDLVISDIASPGMDGFQLMKAMKSEEKWRNIPVIIFSGAGEDYILKAREQGAYRAFGKRVDLPELLSAVDRALRGNDPGLFDDEGREDR